MEILTLSRCALLSICFCHCSNHWSLVLHKPLCMTAAHVDSTCTNCLCTVLFWVRTGMVLSTVWLLRHDSVGVWMYKLCIVLFWVRTGMVLSTVWLLRHDSVGVWMYKLCIVLFWVRTTMVLSTVWLLRHDSVGVWMYKLCIVLFWVRTTMVLSTVWLKTWQCSCLDVQIVCAQLCSE